MGKLNWYRYGKVQYVDLPNGVTYQLNAHNVLKCNVPGSNNVRSQANVTSLEEAEQRIILAAKQLYGIDLSKKIEADAEIKTELKVKDPVKKAEEIISEKITEEKTMSVESATSKRKIAKAIIPTINIVCTEESDGNTFVKLKCNISNAKLRYSTTGKDVTYKNKLFIEGDSIPIKAEVLLKVAAFDEDNKIIATTEKQF